jgi:hypothetical protein
MSDYREAEDIRIHRVKALIFKAVPGVEYRWQNPVPVYSGGRLVGAAVLENHVGDLYANVMVDYETPERMDIETRNIWAIPDRVKIARTYRPCECGQAQVPCGQVMTVGALRLSLQPMDISEEPLNTGPIL